jgi:hypothetical protein
VTERSHHRAIQPARRDFPFCPGPPFPYPHSSLPSSPGGVCDLLIGTSGRDGATADADRAVGWRRGLVG